VSGSNLLNEQHLDVTLDTYWALTEELSSHFLINNKYILCYVNNINKKGKPGYVAPSSMRLVLPQGRRKLVMGWCHSEFPPMWE